MVRHEVDGEVRGDVEEVEEGSEAGDVVEAFECARFRRWWSDYKSSKHKAEGTCLLQIG